MRFLNRISLLLALATAALAGCDDSKSNSTPDAGNDSGAGENTCPAQAPDRDELDPSCCFRSSNADKQDAPQFRLTSLNISAPAPLANPLIVSIVQGALNNESFNWLVQLDGAGGDGDVTVRTGLGIRAADGSFSFAYGQAPAPGSANRW
ncbi:MAG: hypothetical protein KC417_08620, partial [Myxococcales bacterium]|nr:hypothetical protein [Myxococcales bacterium]